MNPRKLIGDSPDNRSNRRRRSIHGRQYRFEADRNQRINKEKTTDQALKCGRFFKDIDHLVEEDRRADQ